MVVPYVNVVSLIGQNLSGTSLGYSRQVYLYKTLGTCICIESYSQHRAQAHCLNNPKSTTSCNIIEVS